VRVEKRRPFPRLPSARPEKGRADLHEFATSSPGRLEAVSGCPILEPQFVTDPLSQSFPARSDGKTRCVGFIHFHFGDRTGHLWNRFVAASEFPRRRSGCANCGPTDREKAAIRDPTVGEIKLPVLIEQPSPRAKNAFLAGHVELGNPELSFFIFRRSRFRECQKCVFLVRVFGLSWSPNLARPTTAFGRHPTVTTRKPWITVAAP